ncbi:butanediol dehydrogenase [Virgibacillus pantothenticus]|uniref:Butanediol dehydrogenase n=1 Tax=Virgibacillus pantothenticus TaxID=1473 RepID=A0A0L0QMY2_VIRPA|nr:2,3-butanediol dehydrogenase [Virgibacillus pantothenticus]KNE19967.1 butanediol dehydrogenase [Virgibacillus pantothenticus]MBU8564984.1 2,3-butanediol dehydrogenase [Virgibacillus pantothenticus]MBU8599291.1 2,3-butanediol dehydrogenase [Virgibacillus pantothenticus]MBU8633306.1 2,3-butanediol dehydrogenase [Virgibacillus pantothenticus]MBU8641033.1 2,3-butanediol dehydrogenase [Virgibacillus pantothenticus]
MKAAVWYAKKDIRVENVDEPVVEAGEVKIKVEWAGICGSDLHEYVAGPITIPTEAPHPLTKGTAPVIMGHEFAGEVVEVGKNVTQVALGDRVTVEPMITCGKCKACRQGRYNLCEVIAAFGMSGVGGGFSEYTVVSEDMVHKIPEHMSYELAALVEPTAVAMHAVKLSNLKVGDTVAVFGAGPIGLLTVQASFLAGAKKVFAIELSEERRKVATKLGAVAISPAESDVAEEIMKQTAGDGADISFEATGVPVVLEQAVNSTKMGGEIVIESLWESKPELDANSLVFKELNLIGSIGYRNIFPTVIDLIADGKLEVSDLVTKKIALDNIVEEGFESLLQEKSQVKILIKP